MSAYQLITLDIVSTLLDVVTHTIEVVRQAAS